MDAAFFFKKIMDHVNEMNTEFNESVRRVGHDEKLFHVSGTINLFAVLSSSSFKDSITALSFIFRSK